MATTPVNNPQLFIWWFLLTSVIAIGMFTWYVGRAWTARIVLGRHAGVAADVVLPSRPSWRWMGDIWDYYLVQQFNKQSGKIKVQHSFFHMRWFINVLLLGVSVILMSVAAYLINLFVTGPGWTSNVVLELVLYTIHLVLYPVTGFVYFQLGWRWAGSLVYFVSWGFLLATAITFGLQRALTGYLLIVPLLIHTWLFIQLLATAWWKRDDGYATRYVVESNSK